MKLTKSKLQELIVETLYEAFTRQQVAVKRQINNLRKTGKISKEVWTAARRAVYKDKQGKTALAILAKAQQAQQATAKQPIQAKPAAGDDAPLSKEDWALMVKDCKGNKGCIDKLTKAQTLSNQDLKKRNPVAKQVKQAAGTQKQNNFAKAAAERAKTPTTPSKKYDFSQFDSKPKAEKIEFIERLKKMKNLSPKAHALIKHFGVSQQKTAQGKTAAKKYPRHYSQLEGQERKAYQDWFNQLRKGLLKLKKGKGLRNLMRDKLQLQLNDLLSKGWKPSSGLGAVKKINPKLFIRYQQYLKAYKS